MPDYSASETELFPIESTVPVRSSGGGMGGADKLMKSPTETPPSKLRAPSLARTPPLGQVRLPARI